MHEMPNVRSHQRAMLLRASGALRGYASSWPRLGGLNVLWKRLSAIRSRLRWPLVRSRGCGRVLRLRS